MKKLYIFLLSILCISSAKAEWSWENFKNYFQINTDKTEATKSQSTISFEKKQFSDALACSLGTNIMLGSAAWFAASAYATSKRPATFSKGLATTLSQMSLPKYYGALTAHSLAFAGLMGIKLNIENINKIQNPQIENK